MFNDFLHGNASIITTILNGGDMHQLATFTRYLDTLHSMGKMDTAAHHLVHRRLDDRGQAHYANAFAMPARTFLELVLPNHWVDGTSYIFHIDVLAHVRPFDHDDAPRRVEDPWEWDAIGRLELERGVPAGPDARKHVFRDMTTNASYVVNAGGFPDA